MALTLTITDIGRAELVNAENTGTTPITLTEVAFGDAGYTPSTEQTELTNEVQRVSTIAGHVVSDDTISVTAKDESSAAYTVREFGLYSESGTLFAVYSQPEPIIDKAAVTTLLMTIDVTFQDLDATSLTFGDVTFSNPPASATVAGVVRLSSAVDSTAEDLAGTPAAVKKAYDNADSRLAKSANLSDVASVEEARANLGLSDVATMKTTASRTNTSTTIVLQAKAMADHVKSGDHDGRYTRPGQYGVGTTGAGSSDPMSGGWGSTSFNTLGKPSGFYYANGITSGRPNTTMGTSDSGALLHRQIGDAGVQLFLSRYPQYANRLFFRNRTSAAYHEWSRALAVTGGGRPFVVSNIANIDETGFYRIEGSTAGAPSGISSGSVLLHICWSAEGTSAAASQLLMGYTSGRLLYRARDSDGKWGNWTEYVSGTRTINSGDGLTGGGSLSANRTLSVDSSVVRTSRAISAGNGLTGGGSLSGNRTISMGTPGTLSSGTGNTVTSSSHTHKVDINGFFTGGKQTLSSNGYQCLPGGVVIQWGTLYMGNVQDVPVDFPIRFPYNVRSVLIGHEGTQANFYGAHTKSASGFTSRKHGDGDHVTDWIAIGY